jgi:ElaB/YqjD/DUF883 family membrane-anchored ribosome-binding protein
MTITAKSQLGPEKGGELQPVSSFYSANGPIGDVIDDFDDDVHVVRDRNGRFAAGDESPVIERVADGISRAAKSVQKTAKVTAVRAQDGARTTAQAVRDHPAMTAAVLGGLATAAYAGVRIYKARQEPMEDSVERAAPKRKVSTSKPLSKRKH